MSRTDPPTELSAGARLRAAMDAERPLQIVGTINPFCALLAERAGFRAIYLSGAGVANATLGLPDLGVISPNDVVAEAAKITAATSLPLLVDCDAGWGSELTIQRVIRDLCRVGVAGVHIEDQISTKRCGHRPGKRLVDREEMGARISAAVQARTDPSFLIMARTDAYGVTGLEDALERSQYYISVGADAIFAEAMTDIAEYKTFTQSLQVPVLANMTEFGKTPLFDREQLHNAGVAIVLYPLSAFRAMNAAATNVYSTIREQGSQRAVLSSMQTRDELYQILGYYEQESNLNSVQSDE